MTNFFGESGCVISMTIFGIRDKLNGDITFITKRIFDSRKTSLQANENDKNGKADLTDIVNDPVNVSRNERDAKESKKTNIICIGTLKV